jgi:hypothetical protein
VIGYVKVEKVAEGSEAWNLKPLEMTRKEQWQSIANGKVSWKKEWRRWWEGKVRKQLC